VAALILEYLVGLRLGHAVVGRHGREDERPDPRGVCYSHVDREILGAGGEKRQDDLGQVGRPGS
jgi:hypothetical protein